ncbi:MAG: sulfatase-like hydrolase/transferase [Deltaproteobacteria bacterium]|nr:sulfatase-like hydrolase/transferase [Deltaproteobacteria bacterium]
MSSSAPADVSAGSREAAAAGAVVALAGSVLFKLATAAGLVAAGSPVTPVILRGAAGFGVDGVLFFALLILGVWLPRTAFGLGVAAGVVGAVDVFFALRFGAPFTPAQLAWAALGAPLSEGGWPALLSLLALAFVLVIAARARPRGPHLIGTACVLLALLGLLGTIVDDDEERRRFGLDESPVAALFQSPRAITSSDASIDDPIVDADPSWSAAVEVAAGAPPRHVVLFLSESTATRFVDDETMPRLMALRRAHSLTFSQHTAQSPISIKAIFSVLCGLHPDPTAKLETTSLPRIDCSSLPETLSARGLDAALFHGGYFAFTDKLAFLGERGFQRLVDGENLPGREQRWHNGWGIDDRAVVDDALAWFDGRPDPRAPSLLVVVPLVPHHEYFLPDDAEKPFGDRTLLERYKNGLRFADDVFARLVDGYRARGVFDDTLFVFAGDHGEAFDEHPRNRLHGSFLYEENVRTPLIIVSTKLFPTTAQTSARPSSHADLLPTILDLLDLPASTSAQGQSLVSSSFLPRPVPLFTAVPTLKVGVRTPRFKLVHDDKSGTDELFDLVADPRERTNLAAAQPQLAAHMRAQALAFLVEQPRRLRAMPKLGSAVWLERVAAAAGLKLADKRVFNMARRCIPFKTSTTTETVLSLPLLDPPARSVGIGVTDESRAARRGAIHADVEGQQIVVDDVFLSSSRVIELSPPRASLSVRIAPSPSGASGCLWLAP